MKTEHQFFEEAFTMQQYMEQMQSYKEDSQNIYDNFQVSDSAFIDKLSKSNLHILAITEDWCGDAMLNNPIMRKIAEAAQLDIRTAKRDEDTSLIDRHLTNGSRAIPIYLFLNEAGNVVGKWGPRAKELQQFVDESRSSLPSKEDATFEIKQKEMYANLIHEYKKNDTFRQFIYESIKATLLEII